MPFPNGLRFLQWKIDTHWTITIPKRLFNQHSLSETLVSDNGTQFTSELFCHFCRSSCITRLFSSHYLFSVPPPDKYGTRPFLKWVRTLGHSPHASGKIQKYLWPRRHPSKRAPQRPGNKQKTIGELYFRPIVCPLPYHPQSNGQAERFLDTFKRVLLKAKGEGTKTEEILQEFLFPYRTTPNGVVKNGMSPVEALMGRKLRIILEALRPHKQQQRQDIYGNKGQTFIVGTPDIARNFRPKQPNWALGTISKRKGKFVYNVQVVEQLWVRHKNQLHSR